MTVVKYDKAKILCNGFVIRQFHYASFFWMPPGKSLISKVENPICDHCNTTYNVLEYLFSLTRILRSVSGT